VSLKVANTQNTLDARPLARKDENLPARVTRIEKHLGLETHFLYLSHGTDTVVPVLGK
jgi:hypothetical protein